ncbi:MAG: mismatch repair protein [Acidobacteriaceae bacterium]
MFLAAAVAAVAMLHTPRLMEWLAIPAAIFVALIVIHDRVIRRLEKQTRVTDFYARGLARLDDAWAGTGETGERFFDAAHAYARDLDLFGKGSLFELLSTARTRAGEETLARWLLQAAAPEEVRVRQAAIREMQERVILRERLFMAGEQVRAGVHPEALAAWGEGPMSFTRLQMRWLPWILPVLGALWVASVGYWGATRSWEWALFMTAVNYSVSWALHRRVDASAAAADKAAEDLRVLAEVLEVMEQETFTAERVVRLRKALETNHIAASAAIRKLKRIYDWLEDRRNGFVAIFNPFVFYTAQLTMAAERWRSRFGPAIRGWLAAVGEFEALAAIAGYAYEHAEDVLPEFVTGRGMFEAEGLAHPLLPAGKAVGNDVTLGREPQLIVVSGPNMAGKSTFLRGVGLNAVLAQCGAPVRAKRLRMSPLAVGASICVLDSLQGGVSRFYAEIQRLKLLADLAAGEFPLLFLLDELLSGTNSHDRLEGTRAVVRELTRRGAIGLVTTHDLALARIPESMDGAGQNWHFEDSLENGRLRFDYRLKPGIVQTSNALRLMKSVGLEVENG